MNKPLFAKFCIILISIFLTSILHAETVSTASDLTKNKKIENYIYSDSAYEALYNIGMEFDKKFGLHQDCKSKYQVEPTGVSIFAPINFPNDMQHPTQGIWQIRYQVKRCGESKLYNALFVASENGNAPPSHKALPPGTTDASLLLIHDAMNVAISSAVIKLDLSDCKEIDIFDMQVTEGAHEVEENGKKYLGVWRESWTFRGCNKTVNVDMTFIPDATGGGTSFRAN